MENDMDITSITDIKELKAMAYDQLATKQLAEQNLVVINQRIDQMAKAQEVLKKAEEAKNG